MAQTSSVEPALELKPLIDYAGVKRIIDTVGLRRALDEVGPQRVLDELLADLTPEEREALNQRLL